MNDIDHLFAEVSAKQLDELVPSDIRVIVAWHRAQRERPQKERPAEEKVDLAKLLGTVRKSSAPVGFVKRF